MLFPMKGRASQAVGRQWALAQELAVVHTPRNRGRADMESWMDGKARSGDQYCQNTGTEGGGARTQGAIVWGQSGRLWVGVWEAPGAVS